MKKRSIRYSNTFIKRFQKLPKDVKLLAVKKENVFRLDPFRPSLNTHKLKGELKSQWAFSINHNYRIVFYFISQSEVVFVAVGTHEVYK